MSTPNIIDTPILQMLFLLLQALNNWGLVLQEAVNDARRG